ncbi:MAG TPA: PspC domain-containing protein [Amycolatopsis sp.]|uniref:PspC domain-containing protein n=1 Tax=Amycolatopsis sp. TaxID=37632 RepID=UPI002B468F01|nr:PspC domain-containing protein [Amycolatopsis sp.]HKS48552.1 PspC domain-containing protein [Amycolatopsis sp.]
MTTTKMLARSRDDRVIAGVCAGLARYLGWKPRTVRLLFLLSCLLPGPQFLLYLALWVIIPQEP